MLDIKTGENYREAAERLQAERDDARARAEELERDKQGWEDECKLFLVQRDEARAALASFAHYVREYSNDPAIVANAERVLM